MHQSKVWRVYYEFKVWSISFNLSSAVQSWKSWVTQHTIHGGWLGGCVNFRGSVLWCGQKWQSNTKMCYLQPVPESYEIDILNYSVDLTFDRRLSSSAAQPSVIFKNNRGILRDNLGALNSQDLWIRCLTAYRGHLERFRTVTLVWFTHDYEIMHKVCSAIEEEPYCFARSSVKFQVHTGRKIDDIDPNWGLF